MSHPCCPRQGSGLARACIRAFRVARNERPVRGESCSCVCHGARPRSMAEAYQQLPERARALMARRAA